MNRMVNGRPAIAFPSASVNGKGAQRLSILADRNAVGQPFISDAPAGLECDPRLAEEFAVAAEAHLDRDLHARARLIERRRSQQARSAAN